MSVRRAAVVVLAALAAVPAAAQAQSPPPVSAPTFGTFRSVLAQGEGQSVNGVDLANYEATGKVPDTFTNQQPLYVGIMPHAATLAGPDLDRFYKNTGFGQMPGGVASVDTPRPGVRIFRDGRYGMAHIYGDTRADLMFGAGYATAQERLFMMDAIRRTAKGTLAGLTGPSAARGDADQLTDQDFSDAELTKQFDALPSRLGPAGARAHADVLAYIDGINARIDEVNANPTELPGEYAALGTRPERWTVSDTVAMAVLLVTQFTVSNGGEEVNAELQLAFRKRFGRRWKGYYRDLREAQDPEAYTVAKRTFGSDRPGKLRRGRNVMPDFGSIKPRDPLVSGPSQAQMSSQAAALPSWARSVERLKKALPPVESNAVMVPRRLSSTGHALAAMGPQVSYFSPQIFSEYELHGGGIDTEGVTFPGASPWPLIGHGIDFAWSGTSANGDNQDTFVERMCTDTTYLYKGKCIPFTMRDQTVTTPLSPVDPTTQPQRITYRTMRSVHGPVFAFATVHGARVALAKAKAVDFHELDAAVPFMRLAENEPHDPRGFMNVMGSFPGTENWFYVDRDNVAFIQSGVYPRHAPGSDVDLPYNGDGRGDWQRFDPGSYTFRGIPPSHRPQAVNPRKGEIVSWNNKEAPGWRKGPREWTNGPVHHARILERRLLGQLHAGHGKVDLVGLTRAVNMAATVDLRMDQDYTFMRKVIGRVSGEDAQMVGLLDDWHASGGNRLDANGDNVYDHSAAIALFDQWWTRFVEAEFGPALGPTLLELVERRVLSLDSDFGWAWASHVQKDLRTVLGKHERGRYSHVYCGGPARTPLKGRQLRRRIRQRCRNELLDTLRGAVAEVKRLKGDDPAGWKVMATCPKQDPPACDQEVPTSAGAVDTPPFPWQNRGTYHQIDEITGHR